jgi:uncharacterized protein (DUF885 family)
MGQLDRLAERYWDALLAHHPTSATLLGDRRFDEEVPDVSEEAEAELAATLTGVLDEIRSIDRDDLDREDRISLDVLAFDASCYVADVDARLTEMHVSPMFGPVAELLRFAQLVTVPEPDHAEALVTRYRRLDRWLDSAAERLRAGMTRERTPARLAVEQVVAQVDGVLAADLADTPFLDPDPPASWSEAQVERWRDRLAEAAREVVLPTLGRYRDTLRDDVARHARGPDESGLCHLADGDEVYATQVRRYTTLERDPAEIHRSGRDEIEVLAGEYRELAGPVLGTSDVDGILARLRTDPELRFSTGEEVRVHAEHALQRANDAVPDWFGRLPVTPCVVREMGPHESEHGTIAYYSRPATDGSRPGAYFVNTSDPETRTRFESEALAFHEAVPGHHLQIALAQEREDVPAFRRHSSVTAYIEGWALYTERLADEMGLYSGEVERLGMLSFDSWRAGRLVVDTGIHALGWTRQDAIDYLTANSPQAENNIANEVDRYIAWPAQALAYKSGQREIRRLRDEAASRLGNRFDVAGFHDAVLEPGSVPLAVLGDLIGEWVADHG